MADPWKPRTGQSIEALYAWVATEPDGGEGILGAHLPGTGTLIMPLVGADIERIRSLRTYAEMIRGKLGYPVRFIRFSQRDDLEVLP